MRLWLSMTCYLWFLFAASAPAGDPGRSATKLVVSPTQKDDPKGIPFGPPAANGLRVAWVLDPAKEAYAIGELIECQVIFQNDGKAPVTFRPFTGSSLGGNKSIKRIIQDANNALIKTKGIGYSGGVMFKAHTLEPGQMVKLPTKGFVFGDGEYRDLRSPGKLGTIVPAQAGDVFRLSWEISLPGMSSAKALAGEWTGTLKSREITVRVAAPK